MDLGFSVSKPILPSLAGGVLIAGAGLLLAQPALEAPLTGAVRLTSIEIPLAPPVGGLFGSGASTPLPKLAAAVRGRRDCARCSGRAGC